MNLHLTEKSLDRVVLPARPAAARALGRRGPRLCRRHRQEAHDVRDRDRAFDPEPGAVKRRQVIGRRGELATMVSAVDRPAARQRAREIVRQGGRRWRSEPLPNASRRRSDPRATRSTCTFLRMRADAGERIEHRDDHARARQVPRKTGCSGRFARSSGRNAARYTRQLTKKHGPYLANRVMRHVRAAWNTALKEHDLPANPTIAVHWNKERRRRSRSRGRVCPRGGSTVISLEPIIVDGKRVGTRPGVRGDYQMFLLLTGLRTHGRGDGSLGTHRSRGRHASPSEPEGRQGARVHDPAQLRVRSHPRTAPASTIASRFSKATAAGCSRPGAQGKPCALCAALGRGRTWPAPSFI